MYVCRRLERLKRCAFAWLARQPAAAGGGGKTAGGEGIAGRGGTARLKRVFGSFVTEFQLFTPSFVKVAH